MSSGLRDHHSRLWETVSQLSKGFVKLTFLKLLETLKRDLELKRVREGRGVVQHSHVDDIY